MIVELRHLRYFVAVGEELHFGRAAARLHMAQPPLSQAVRQLEHLMGCTLLVRTSRSVRLTPAGAAFLERARRTLRNVSDDVREARSIGRGETGLLNVGFVGSAMLTDLPEVFRRHVDAYPGVQLQLHESFTSQVVAGLLDGGLDAGVVRDSEPVEGLVATPLSAEPFVRSCPPTTPAPTSPRCPLPRWPTSPSSRLPAAPALGRTRRPSACARSTASGRSWPTRRRTG